MTDLVVRPVLDLTDSRAVVGKHSVWLPPQDGSIFGIKVAFQFGGTVVKYQHDHETHYPLDTLGEEVAFMRALAERRWGPPVGRWVYFKEVISLHNGYWWSDPCGALGVEVADADRVPEPGEFTVEKLRESGLVEASAGAWSDIEVPSRGNVRRGYLIDTRRSWFDRLKYLGTPEPVQVYHEDTVALRERLHREGQFPFGKRSQAYQEFYLDREWHKAEREVVKRAEILGFDPKPGESVVDLGCCAGGFLQYAALRQAQKTPWMCSCPDSKGCQPIAPMTPIGPLVGIDGQPEFVDLARALARANDWNICYRLSDLRYDMDTANWIRSVFPNGVDHLLCLSMGKHLGEQTMWWYVDHLNAKRTYLETNAVNPGEYPWADEVKRRGGCYVGDTRDRNTRRAYVIERHSR